MLNNATLPATDRQAVVNFQAKVSELARMVASANAVRGDLMKRIKFLKAAVKETPKAPVGLLAEIESIESRLQAVSIKMNGDGSLARRQFETAPSIEDRVSFIVYGLWNSTIAPTESQKQSYEIAADEFEPVLKEIKQIAETDLKKIEQQLEGYGAPWTPGRILNWNRE